MESKDYKFIDEANIEDRFNELKKIYQNDIDRLLQDYDELLKDAMTGLIANHQVSCSVREDILGTIDSLIRIRPFIVDYCSNYCSNDN